MKSTTNNKNNEASPKILEDLSLEDLKLTKTIVLSHQLSSESEAIILTAATDPSTPFKRLLRHSSKNSQRLLVKVKMDQISVQ